MGIECKGCNIWEGARYTGCMFTPTVYEEVDVEINCPCINCVVKIMCTEEQHKTCVPFDDYLKVAERIIYT